MINYIERLHWKDITTCERILLFYQKIQKASSSFSEKNIAFIYTREKGLARRNEHLTIKSRMCINAENNLSNYERIEKPMHDCCIWGNQPHSAIKFKVPKLKKCKHEMQRISKLNASLSSYQNSQTMLKRNH